MRAGVPCRAGEVDTGALIVEAPAGARCITVQFYSVDGALSHVQPFVRSKRRNANFMKQMRRFRSDGASCA